MALQVLRNYNSHYALPKSNDSQGRGMIGFVISPQLECGDRKQEVTGRKLKSVGEVAGVELPFTRSQLCTYCISQAGPILLTNEQKGRGGGRRETLLSDDVCFGVP